MKPLQRTALAVAGAIGVVAAAVGVGWLIRSSRNESLTAAVYGAYIAIGGIALTLLMTLGTWWLNGRSTAAGRASTAEQLAAAADWLAGATAARWRQEAVQRRIVTPAPATVQWRWADEESTGSRLELTTPPPAGTGPPPLPDLGEPGELLESGVVARLHDEVYARLQHGRLVLVGGPGSGKTGAMILLLLAALACRDALPAVERARVPVPVWLTLGGWNPASQTLREAVVTALIRDFPALRAPDYGQDAAAELLRAGRVALFLDGLDEMPQGVRAQALGRIDAEAQAVRVVLTTRPAEFRAALQAGRPDNTAVIELRPVRPRWAAEYLLHGQTGRRRERWQQVGDFLTSNPGGVLARALDNPLNLSLARDTYASQDPTVLTDLRRFPTAGSVGVHLIDQFLVAAYPAEDQRAQAVGWLGWLAHRMGTSRDLPWWEIAGWPPHWRLRLARGLLVGAVATVVAWTAAATQFGTAVWLPLGVWLGAGTGLMAGLVVRLRVRYPGPRAEPAQPWLNCGTVGLAVVVALLLVSRYPDLTYVLAAAVLVVWVRRRERTGRLSAFIGPLTRARRRWQGVPVLERTSARALLAGCIAGVVTAAAVATISGQPGTGVVQGLIFGPASAILVGLVSGLLSTLQAPLAPANVVPRAIVPRWPRGRMRPLTIPLAVLLFPLVVPVLLGRWSMPAADSPSATASSAYQADRRTCAVYGCAYGVQAAVLAGLISGSVAGDQTNTFAALPAVAWGLAVGIVVFVVAWLAGGQVPLLKLTELVLGRQQGRRVRFMGLLEDALGRQVLRQAGSVYQFRHGALQSRLALRYADHVSARPAGSAAPPSPPAPEQMGAGEQGMQNVGGGGAA
jgi:hypothetical protein